MRIVFMGTPDFAVPTLEILHRTGYEITGVFTQPDKPAGRGNKLKAGPVKEAAMKLGLSVFQPVRIKAPEAVALLRELRPDCIVVVAFGQILSAEILHIPPFGCINVHASLLPQYRGAAPIHRAVLNGDKMTGITTMFMDEGLDTGDILLQAEIPIEQNDSVGVVHDQLAQTGAQLLLDTLKKIKEKTLRRTPQSQDFTYAPMLTKEDEYLDWKGEATQIHNQIRGLNPWPGACTSFRGEKVKIWSSEIVGEWRPELAEQTAKEEALKENRAEATIPGTILAMTAKGFICSTGRGYIEILEIQPAGKTRMKARDFINGRRISPGEFFGE
ncbi:methionyl-tRNA formyltransferase [Syntrophobotulus glycolicus DSM 8271]|uniref:Methionyl-tRNA formyltransferase n=1 Tax=Syntrophobotulus glycolicus (strain DSM 8271 / FlGlyR) TaxID=645991 RepID=F0SUR4_SYNGF|nr:methionyl-tRNA formyltransferase [Syntrophobotulus glycolicus]ADY56630.1 methionyl-tRNA formyltransferase [Syntrophobotulus glycolicus DSM 8271]